MFESLSSFVSLSLLVEELNNEFFGFVSLAGQADAADELGLGPNVRGSTRAKMHPCLAFMFFLRRKH